MKKSIAGKEFQGFPDYYREFIWNGLSVRVDASGGIEALRIVRHEANKPFAVLDVEPTQLFGRAGNKCMIHPLYGPAIGFYTETCAGRVIPHFPQRVNIRPDGFESTQDRDGFSSEYDFLVTDHGFHADFRCMGKDGKTFFVQISKNHLNSGKFASAFNPMLAEAALHQLESFQKKSFQDHPFPRGCGVLSWGKPTLKKKTGILVLEAVLEYPFGRRSIFLAFGCNGAAKVDEDDNFYSLRMAWSETNKIRFAMAMGDSWPNASARLQSALSNSTAWGIRERKYKKILSVLPEWDTETSLVREFAKNTACYTEALLLNETAQSAGIKPAAGKYGFCSVWDHTLSVRNMLLNGRPDISEKMLRYQAHFPHFFFAITFTPIWICQLEDHLAFTGDLGFVREVWPQLMTFFRVLKKICEQNDGLLRCSRGYGVDRGSELGFDSIYYSSDVNGMLYNAFRAVENMAYCLKETKTAHEAERSAAGIEKQYIKLFFDRKVGYLRSGIMGKGKKNPFEVYQNVAAIPLLYPYGQYLLRRVVKDLASYQVNKLYDPRGMAAVARDSRIHCEMWRNCHMNQHLGHESMLARLAGMPGESERLLEGFLETYQKHHVAAETFNLAGCMGDEGNNADWQSFASAGAMDSICGGLIGLGRHAGGLHYVPAANGKPASVKNFLFRGTRWNIRITGRGDCAESIFNGKQCPGTLQVPLEMYENGKTIDWEIRLSRKKNAEPVLLSLTGTGIRDLIAKPGKLSFRITETAHAVLHVLCADKVNVYVNRKPCAAERIGQELYLDDLFSAGDSVLIEKDEQGN